MTSRLLCVGWLILAIACLWPQASARAADPGPSFSIIPADFDPHDAKAVPYFNVASNQGATTHLSLRISNVGSQVGTALIYAVDMTTGTTSGAVFKNRTDVRSDVGSWIQLPISTVTLEPDTQQTIEIEVIIPQGAGPGEHLGGIIAETEQAPIGVGQSEQITVKVRAAVAVEVTLPGATLEQLGMTDSYLETIANIPNIVLHLANSGTQLLKPIGTIQIFDSHQQQVWKQDLHLDTLVPHTDIDYPVALKGATLGVGIYHVKLSLTYGHGLHLDKEWTLNLQNEVRTPTPPQNFSFDPRWLQIIGIGLLVLLGILGWWRQPIHALRKMLRPNARHPSK